MSNTIVDYTASVQTIKIPSPENYKFIFNDEQKFLQLLKNVAQFEAGPDYKTT